MVSGENLHTNMPAVWTNEQETTSGGTQFQFLIDDTHFFLIDDTFKLVIQDGTLSVWTNEQES